MPWFSPSFAPVARRSAPWLLLLAACASDRSALPERQLSLTLSGCAATTSDGTCELPEGGELRVIVPMAGHERVVLASDGGTATVLASESVAAGRRLRVALPSRATRLDVTVRGASFLGRGTARLSSPRVPGWFPEAERARRESATEEAERAAGAALERASERAFALGVLARCALGRGETARADALLAEASTLHRSAGRSSDAARDGFARVYIAIEAGQLDRAEPLLQALAPQVAAHPDDLVLLDYYRAQLARALGEFDLALSLIAQAERAAERLGHEANARWARWERMVILLALGETRTAEGLFERLARDGDRPFVGCDRPNLLVSLAFARNVLSPEDGRATAALLQPALAQEGCRDPRVLANVRYELAHALLLAGDLSAAEAALAASRTELGARDYRELELEWSQLAGRLALARGEHAAARAHFAQMVQASDGPRWLEPRARALFWSARASEAAGQPEVARAAYVRMEETLDQLTARAPLGEGRVGVAASARGYSESHLRFALARGAEDEALAVFLRSRARTTRLLVARARLSAQSAPERTAWLGAVGAYQRLRRELEQSEAQAWQLTGAAREAAAARREQLERELLAVVERALAATGLSEPVQVAPQPAKDELILALSPAEPAVALLGHAGGVRAVRLTPAAARPESDAARWLGELDAPLAAARRVQLLVPEEYESVDWHALPWRGEPLGAAREVVYSQGHPVAAAALPLGAHVVVLADPSGDLPAARHEAAWLAAHLPGRSEALAPEIDARSLREQLAAAQVFHFAGHTRFDPVRPWRLGLVLARETLGLADVLALARAPALVVLSACDGARASSGHAIAGALVAAGARAVVAPARPVADTLSLAFTRAFYTALAVLGEPAAAAARAQVELAAAGAGDWAAFRVVVP